jgi:hypothetical protein
MARIIFFILAFLFSSSENEIIKTFATNIRVFFFMYIYCKLLKIVLYSSIVKKFSKINIVELEKETWRPIERANTVIA